MTSATHPKKLCPFFHQRCWLGEASSSPPESRPQHAPSSPSEIVSQRPRGRLTRLSRLQHPLNRLRVGTRFALLGSLRH